MQQQQEDLISYLKEFALQYKEKSSCNVTYKMHLLFAHLQSHLESYHIVGLLSEDSMESIHAVINRLTMYMQVWIWNGRLKPFCNQSHNKKEIFAKHNAQISKNANKDVPIMKQKHRQGVAKETTAVSTFVDVLANLAPDATRHLRDWNWGTNDPKEPDYPGFHMQYGEVLCEDSHVHLNCDERITSQLTDWHNLVKHVHAEDKFNISKVE